MSMLLLAYVCWEADGVFGQGLERGADEEYYFCPRWYVILCEVITLKSDMTQSRDVLQNWRAFVCYGRCHHQNQSPGWIAFERRSKLLLEGYISIRAGGAFQSEQGVHFNQSRGASQSQGVHFNWSGCILNERVHFKWSG